MAVLAVEAAGLGFFALLTPPPHVLPLAALPVLPLTVVGWLAVVSLSGGAGRRPSMRGLSPDDIVRSRPARAETVPTPAALSRSIVERAGEIKKAMQEEPRSEVRVEMCSLGYRACANDMITLTHLVNGALGTATLLERLRLRRHRRRAAEALSAAREALPPGALRATRQEQP
jgi:hypothetical protein